MSLYLNIHKKLGKFTLNIRFGTDGGILGLLGASGCGKSMTLKCIAGVEKPDYGKIILNGTVLFDSTERINISPQNRRTGLLFQNYALFPNMTVRQNILCGFRQRPDHHVYNDIIDLLQIGGLQDMKPSQLSGGQQQRTALARILVNDPEIIMLDEPFSALDSHLRGELQIQLQQLLKNFGKDVVIVTHSRTEAYKLCSDIALVDKGKILAHKETKALFADPGSRAAARLTGCKNIVSAVKCGENEVFVRDWDMRFRTALPIRGDLCAIAIRAHYFKANLAQNRNAVCFMNKLEEPFEYIMQFRYPMQSENSPDIWWRVSKDVLKSLPDSLGIDPADVLPLYD